MKTRPRRAAPAARVSAGFAAQRTGLRRGIGRRSAGRSGRRAGRPSLRLGRRGACRSGLRAPIAASSARPCGRWASSRPNWPAPSMRRRPLARARVVTSRRPPAARQRSSSAGHGRALTSPAPVAVTCRSRSVGSAPPMRVSRTGRFRRAGPRVSRRGALARGARRVWSQMRLEAAGREGEVAGRRPGHPQGRLVHDRDRR